MISLTNFISKRIVLMLIVLIAVATAGMLYSHSRSIPEEEMFLAMDFTIDANTDNGAFLRFVTPDGKERIEVYEGQFADGTKIFESRNFKHDLGWWEQSTVGQGEQTVDKVRGVGGNQFYHLLEIMDPAITSLVWCNNTATKSAEENISILQNTQANSMKNVIEPIVTCMDNSQNQD